MAGKPQKLSEGQKKQVTWLLWKQILAVLLVILALLGGSLWEIYERLGQKVETLVAKQFKEPRIQEVVNNVAATKAEALLIEQINPEVAKFKAEINSQIEEIRSIVARIETLKAQSDSNAKQIEKVLSSARRSEQEIEKFKKAISGLQSDLIKINRGLVEIQYFSAKGALSMPNPYRERIQKTLNEIIVIAVPDSKERSEFVQELKAYQPKD